MSSCGSAPFVPSPKRRYAVPLVSTSMTKLRSSGPEPSRSAAAVQAGDGGVVAMLSVREMTGTASLGEKSIRSDAERLVLGPSSKLTTWMRSEAADILDSMFESDRLGNCSTSTGSETPFAPEDGLKTRSRLKTSGSVNWPWATTPIRGGQASGELDRTVR